MSEMLLPDSSDLDAFMERGTCSAMPRRVTRDQENVRSHSQPMKQAKRLVPSTARICGRSERVQLIHEFRHESALAGNPMLAQLL